MKALSDLIRTSSNAPKMAAQFEGRPLIIATEDGVFHQIAQQPPDKEPIQAPGMDESCACNRCPLMRLNALEKLYLCLRDFEPEVTLPEDVQVRALAPIQRMLDLPQAP
jgi:quinolinate synthase